MMRAFFFFLFFLCARLFAQPTGTGTLLSVNEGLSQGMVFDVMQSRDGYLWVATKGGLNRHDGYRFKVFGHDAFDPFSIGSNEIRDMHDDPRGWLWLTYQGGIDIFMPSNGRAFHVPIVSQRGFSGFSDSFAKMPDGSVWLNTSMDLWRIEVSEDILAKAGAAGQAYPGIKYVSLDELVVGLPPDLRFNSVYLTKDQTLLTGTLQGIFRIEKNGIQYRFVPEAMKGKNCRIIGEDKAGRLWVFADDDLWVREQNDRPFEKVLSGVSFKWIFDQEGNLWNLDAKAIRKWIPDKLVKNAAPDYAASVPASRRKSYAFYQTKFNVDQSGNVWIGTSGYGLIKINSARPKFNSFLPEVSTRRIYEDPNGNLFNIYSSELFFTDKHFLIFGPNPWMVNFPNVKNIFALTFDNQGHCWTKTGIDSVFHIDASTKKITSYPFPGYGLIFHRNGKLLSAGPDSLYEFDPIRKISTGQPYGKNLKLSSEGEFFGNLFYQGSYGDVWLFTVEGLLRISPESAGYRFRLFQNDPANLASLSNNVVLSAAEDPLEPRRYLWAGTRGGGLNRLDLQSGEFKHYTTKQGLPDNVIYGILPDNAGHLWMSTNKGLCRFHVRNETVKNFTLADGLQENEFNHSSFLKTRDGTLIFGGVNGVTTFHPDSLRFNEQKPRTVITQLWVNNENWDIGVLGYSDIGQEASNTSISQYPNTSISQYPNTSISQYPNTSISQYPNIPIPQYPNIKLSHRQNLITFEFAALEFTNPPQNLYRYQLRHHRLFGMDEGKDWVELGTRNSVQFANLQPGSYTFKVLGSNNDGIWSEQPAVLEFTIRPPWWAAWWAYLFYALAIGTGIWLFYRYQLRQKLEHQETLRLRELDEFKNRFFTNITHEFRTPLTVILGTAEQVETKVGEEFKPKLGLIRRNGQNLLRLINQLLDLAKLESNTLKLNYVQGDVLPYLRYIAESLHSLANTQNVMLRVESTETEIVMDYDPERLLQIVYNLLSNAIKFTPSGGRVTLRATTDLPGFQNLAGLTLVVSDTGAGIPPEDLPHIFDRFYQANNLEKARTGGTGIGLALTKELVKAMGGEISVESEVGKGATFTVRLPLALSPLTPEGEPQSPNSAEFIKEKVASELPGIGSPFRGSGGLSREDNPSILLIEDNPDVVEYLATCLNEYYQLDFAYNGRAGMEKALETVPDLIVSDVMMPEKDGFEVCETLKNDERTSHIPIVLLTAKAGVENRIAGLKRGADAYLAKPFHQEELLITLANLLEIRRKLQVKYSTMDLTPAPLIPHPSSLIPDPEDAFLQKVKTAILERLSDPNLNVEDLCRALAMSHPQLHRKLAALTGKGPAALIRSMRLARAKELLMMRGMNVSEVAFEVGFDDPKYFSRVFNEEFGIPPSKI